jgi:hypothetical protein
MVHFQIESLAFKALHSQRRPSAPTATIQRSIIEIDRKFWCSAAASAQRNDGCVSLLPRRCGRYCFPPDFWQMSAARQEGRRGAARQIKNAGKTGVLIALRRDAIRYCIIGPLLPP